jgi:SAM-dependent methyltransferase
MSHDHWQGIYETRDPTRVGWYEPLPETSWRLVSNALARGARSVIDIGGGASSLVDLLLDASVERVAVLDISEAGLELARQRLGERAGRVEWIAGDVTGLEGVGTFDLWHDRAAFHFLLDPAARQRYVRLATRTVVAGGTAVIATFAPDGPERCSGLPIQRWDPGDLARELGHAWRLTGDERHLHVTPLGVEQRYVYCTFMRIPSPGPGQASGG